MVELSKVLPGANAWPFRLYVLVCTPVLVVEPRPNSSDIRLALYSCCQMRLSPKSPSPQRLYATSGYLRTWYGRDASCELLVMTSLVGAATSIEISDRSPPSTRYALVSRCGMVVNCCWR